MMTSGFKRCGLTLNLEHLWVQSSKQPQDLGLFFFSLYKFTSLMAYQNIPTLMFQNYNLQMPLNVAQ